jgi:CheY-like chemotaxis protein
MRELFETVLTDKGYHVETTSNGRQGIELIESGDVDVLISDIKMPDITGIEVLQSVKKLEHDVGVVLMTGYASLETAIDALRLGADDYLLKPIEDFEGTVVNVIERVGEKRRLAKENRRLTTELNQLNQRLKGSNSDLRRMVAQVTTLQQTNQMINGCDDPETILEVVGDGLSIGFDVSSFVITLADDQGWHEPVRWHGLSSEEARAYSYSPGIGTVGQAVSSTLPSIIEVTEATGDPARKVIVLPLLAAGNVTGSLIITGLEAGREMDEDSLKLFAALAAQFSAPLELARIKTQGALCEKTD